MFEAQKGITARTNGDLILTCQLMLSFSSFSIRLPVSNRSLETLTVLGSVCSTENDDDYRQKALLLISSSTRVPGLVKQRYNLNIAHYLRSVGTH